MLLLWFLGGAGVRKGVGVARGALAMVPPKATHVLVLMLAGVPHQVLVSALLLSVLA